MTLVWVWSLVNNEMCWKGKNEKNKEDISGSSGLESEEEGKREK